MARSRKVDPVPLSLSFVTPQPEPGGSVTSYIDLSQCASLAARKFFRQGLNWGFAGIKFNSQGSGVINVYKLPNSWVMANSWVKSYSTWSQMNNEALAEAESARPRFLDFKIYADSEHHSAGIPANLLPLAVGGATTVGEWESSKVLIPVAQDDTQPIPSQTMEEYELIATGMNYPGVSPVSGLDAVSLIEGYAASRALPAIRDPNVPDDMVDASGRTPENWMTAVFNEGITQDSEVLEVLTSENNIAPYPFENDGVNLDTMYPGGANQMSGLENHDFAQIYSTSATTNVGITRIKGGNLPCGIIKVVWTPAEGTPVLGFIVEMLAGPHSGYLAQPMQEMN